LRAASGRLSVLNHRFSFFSITNPKPALKKVVAVAESKKMSFIQFGLHSSLMRAIIDSGYTDPTDIQTKAIPAALEGRDVLGCAMTGSGKTAAFVLPILQRIMHLPRRATRALVLVPTRELAAQVQAQFEQLGAHTGIRSTAIFGGVSMQAQTRAFESGVDVIVATPGRLLDHFKNRYAKLEQLEVLVFDEADRMLDMGFLPDIKRVLKHIPKPKQTLFFSATMPPLIAQLAKDLLYQPVTINTERQAMPASGITQWVYPVPQDLKAGLLLKLLEEIGSVIVFTRTKHRANRLSKFLVSHDINAERIHGDRSQGQRTEALTGFKSGKYRVLVATDIAARGIDIADLEHVINFDVPNVPEDYIHRVGRTARAERTGEALTFVSPEEEGNLRDIEKAISLRIPKAKVEGFDYNATVPKVPQSPAKRPSTTEHRAPIKREPAHPPLQTSARQASKFKSNKTSSTETRASNPQNPRRGRGGTRGGNSGRS
jgi:ATP-dependent RNA helicase RhlE